MSMVTYSNITETDKVGPFAPNSMPELNTYEENEEVDSSQEQQPGQTDIWNLIQSQQKPVDVPPPYVHPLVRRSSSSLSQKSLEICTESLGSETGSDDSFLFSSSDSDTDDHPSNIQSDQSNDLQLIHEPAPVVVKIGGGRKSPPRSFPPPLPSMTSSRNGGPCLRMRPHRCGNGRLVMEAVSIPTQTYLHARRLHGRLLLSFNDQTEQEESDSETDEEEEVEMEESEEEEEVEVVDRGTMVEVKVSTQAQVQPNQLDSNKKVHRSSLLVINKFVGSSPDDAMTAAASTAPAVLPRSRRAVAMPTTAAAAVVAASALSASSRYEEEEEEEEEEEDGKLLFVATTAGSRRRSKEELLHQMRRCSQLRRPLFIWEKEPRCIATL